MKKIFFALLLTTLVIAVEQPSILASFSFQEQGLVFESARLGMAELPNYDLHSPQEHSLFVRYYSGSTQVKEIIFADPRYKTGESIDSEGNILRREFFIKDAELNLVLPFMQGACIVSIHDSTQELSSFNACTLSERKSEAFYSYSTLGSRDLDYAILAISLAFCLVLGLLIVKRLKR